MRDGLFVVAFNEKRERLDAHCPSLHDVLPGESEIDGVRAPLTGVGASEAALEETLSESSVLSASVAPESASLSSSFRMVSLSCIATTTSPDNLRRLNIINNLNISGRRCASVWTRIRSHHPHFERPHPYRAPLRRCHSHSIEMTKYQVNLVIKKCRKRTM